MPLPTFYTTGTASVANAATTITFTGALLGTAELPTFRAGDLFFDPAQPLVPGQRLASVDYDAGTAELWVNWPGTSMTADPYEVRFTDDGVRSTAQTRRYLERLGLLAALGIQPDAFGDFADRDVYDDEAEGFIFLSLDGDGVSGIWTLYAKLSVDDGDWSAGQMVDENPGPAGPAGANGTNGADGAPGVGVPAGGAIGQVLKKLSATNYDTGWAADAGGIGGSLGSTDNALVRADGAGGSTAQGSVATLSDAGSLAGLTEMLMGGVSTTVMNEVGVGSSFVPTVQIHGAGTVGLAMYRWSANNVGPRAGFVKSRGAVNTNGVVSSGDMIGMFVFDGDDGAAYPTAAAFGAYVDGTPGSSDMPGRLVFLTTPDGAVTPAERLRIDNAGVISHRANATVIVDANSHLGLRSYTVATLPSASTAARLIYVSDGTSNKRLAVSDGTNWRWPDGAIVS